MKNINAIISFSQKNKKITFLLILVLFLSLRIPLLFSLFFHVDDTYVAQGVYTTYPLITYFISKIASFLCDNIFNTLFELRNSFVCKVQITRAISLILSTAGIILFFKTIKTTFKKDSYVFFSALIICFSQMHITYSVHSSPYGYSMISTCIFVLFLLKYNELKIDSYRFYVMTALLLMTVYIDNFAIMYFPALFVSIFIFQRRNLKKNKKDIIKFSISLGASVINCLCYYYSFLKPILKHHGGVNYNRGSNDEFIFLKESIYELFLHPIKTILFFSNNCFMIFENNLAFYEYSKVIEMPLIRYLIAPIFLIITLRFILINSHNKFFVFIIFFFITIFFFVYIEKLSLSPTRHFICLTPLIIILIMYYLQSFKLQIRSTIALIIITTVFFTTAFSYPKFLQRKNNNINYEYLESTIKQNRIDFVVDYDYTDFIQSMFKGFNRNKLSAKINKIEHGNFKLLFISHRKPIEQSSVISEFLSKKPNAKIKITKKDIFVSNEQVGRNPIAKNGANSKYSYLADYNY